MAAGMGSDRVLYQPKTQVLDHRIEIAIVVKQPMTQFDTERADNQVDSLPYGDPPRPKQAIICGCAHGKSAIQHGHHVEAPQAAFDAHCHKIVPRTL